MITNKEECYQAAKDLHLGIKTSAEHQIRGEPQGCLWMGAWTVEHGTGSHLLWAPSEANPYPNVPCGTTLYNCICSKPSKINFLLVKQKCTFKTI